MWSLGRGVKKLYSLLGIVASDYIHFILFYWAKCAFLSMRIVWKINWPGTHLRYSSILVYDFIHMKFAPWDKRCLRFRCDNYFCHIYAFITWTIFHRFWSVFTAHWFAMLHIMVTSKCWTVTLNLTLLKLISCKKKMNVTEIHLCFQQTPPHAQQLNRSSVHSYWGLNTDIYNSHINSSVCVCNSTLNSRDPSVLSWIKTHQGL